MTLSLESSAEARRLSGRRFTRAGLAITITAVLLLAAALRFWLHDAFPYMADYTETGYRRYWPNRHHLLLHILGGSLALLTGPVQLWSGLRRWQPRLHRALGYVYMGGVALGASASFYLTFHTRPDFGLALFVLAIMWWVAIAMAYIAIRNRRLDAHREWMIRSYIVTFAFVSYRYGVGLSVFDGLGSGREASVLWLSWVVPMMFFELYLQRTRVFR